MFGWFSLIPENMHDRKKEKIHVLKNRWVGAGSGGAKNGQNLTKWCKILQKAENKKMC
jgi:hypothetical protein